MGSARRARRGREAADPAHGSEDVDRRWSHPFGNPDGSRADIGDVLDDFVDFHGDPMFGAVATRADDARVRVIAGRMGAGKTVYMRRLHNHQARSESVFAARIQQNPPSTEVIVRACQWFPERYLASKWKQLWRCAVLRSLATHLLAEPQLRRYLTEEQERSLRRGRYVPLIDAVHRPRSVYTELQTIIAQARSGHHLTTFIDDPRWEELEDVLSELLACTPPVFFYIDAVDEEFSSAPMYWLRCQRGLFDQTMRLLRDPRFGGRLHLVACIRDIVLSSIYRDEHAPRYHGEPHIRVLSWGGGTIRVLLRHKLHKLSRHHLLRPDEPDLIVRWLGLEQIPNVRRGVTERTLDYLLRHTRLIPRDIVSLGNALCLETLRHGARGSSALQPEVLRRVVSKAAQRFGASQLAQCANQITADMMPREAAVHGYSDSYTSSHEYAETVQRQLRDIIGVIGVDRFGYKDLVELRRAGHEVFAGATDVPSVLWQNGLLGYAASDHRFRFYSLHDIDDFEVSEDEQEYAFHPIVLDSVRGMTSTAEHPVHPYVRE